jgi:[protein-PII] uridylyltransferase
MDVIEKIEDIIITNSGDFQLSQVIKEELITLRESFEIVYKKTQGKKFMLWHTKSIDLLIKSIYRYLLRSCFSEYVPMMGSIPITIVALGSYGREQLAPYSDIDIMVVYKIVDGYNIEPIIQRFIQILWDSGFKVGHRVHSLGELFQVSNSDQTIKSSFLESRFITGSKHLWVDIENEIFKIRNSDKELFVSQKLDEYKDRYRHYTFTMQPDIKLTSGGIRDFNSLFWLTVTLKSLPKVKNLPNSIISYNDLISLISSLEFLFKVRCALHIISQKKEDRLILEYIPSLSEILNFKGDLTKKIFSSIHKIRVITSYTIIKMTSDLPYKRFSLKTMFMDMQNSKNVDRKYDSSFIYYLINSKKDSFKIKKEFFERRYLYNILIALYDARVLSKYFPPFQKILHLAQFDGYHIFPVDIHLLQAVKVYEDIQDPYMLKLYLSLNRSQVRVLKFATLFHDIGKGRKQDHSILGANIGRKFAKELGFNDVELQLIYILIRYHITLNMVATTQDIYSDKIIFSFVSKINSYDGLKLLMLLTYADLNSVSSRYYTSFNSNLIKKLYEISCEALKNKKMVSEATKRAKCERAIQRCQEFINLSRDQKKAILNVESNLLLFKYSPEKIVEISKWCFDLDSRYEYRLINDDILTIEIIKKDEFNLGYFLGRISTLSVTHMDIFKFFNSIKYFKISFLQKLDESIDLEYIKSLIKESFLSKKVVELPHINISSKEIDIDCNHSRSYAQMTINAKDQRGLLANIISVFDDVGVDIASAKMQTIKGRARDLILVEKNGKFCKKRDKIISKIIKG